MLLFDQALSVSVKLEQSWSNKPTY